MNQPAAVQMPAAVYKAIVVHAREGKPEEICGIVRGRGQGGVRRATPAMIDLSIKSAA